MVQMIINYACVTFVSTMRRLDKMYLYIITSQGEERTF